MNKGQLDLALADFVRALSLDPELAGAYADRGRAYELKGDRDKAVADYRKSLSLKSRQVYDDKAKAAALQHLTALAAVAPGSAAPSAGSPDPQAAKPKEPAQAEKRVALVIANGAYANVKALKNADSDARAVAASLRQLGFDVIEKHDLTLADLTKEFKAFGDRAPGYDWAVVYLPATASRSAGSIISSNALHTLGVGEAAIAIGGGVRGVELERLSKLGNRVLMLALVLMPHAAIKIGDGEIGLGVLGAGNDLAAAGSRPSPSSIRQTPLAQRQTRLPNRRQRSPCDPPPSALRRS